ncbi:MAG: hypothetical protein JXR67_03985 [Bacteroidales bacterium]|nr:hypothetical protein [Bacteroidales bacterium]
MKKTILTGLFAGSVMWCTAQHTMDYKSLDPGNPIVFGGDHIIFRGKTINLGPKAFFIDGQFSDAEAEKFPFVFNSVNRAAEHLTDGTEESPMVLYIAPYVYWIDDPDDPAVRVPVDGQSPYGLVIRCDWLKFYGLSDHPGNVVLACNRGQTIGSQGNFTMFRISGQGPGSENVTFGNYCNVDLVYPLKPELNREKRASAIVQAQLILCDGDKIVAHNTRFISRLNLLPFFGGKRTLFEGCHFESTDDALSMTGLYLNCTFDFYSSKPFVATTGTGAIFLNCDIRSYVKGEQYFTKLNGQIAVVDTRIRSETASYLGWRDIPPPEMRNYQYNVILNDKDVLIGEKHPASTVDMTGKQVLEAYRFEHNGEVIYNTYNLLCGNDDWDPMGIKDVVLSAQEESGRKLTMLPVQLLIVPEVIEPGKDGEKTGSAIVRSGWQFAPVRATIETGKNAVRLTATVNRFGNYELKGETVKWVLAPGDESLVKLKVSDDGSTCDVIPVSMLDETKQVVITAHTPSGLKAASVLTVSPAKLIPPEFISKPVISTGINGKLTVDYQLDMQYDDQSLVTWYRCGDPDGSDPIEVAVSRMNHPLREYELSAGDIGYYIMASVAPKHLRCDAGEAVFDVMKEPVSEEDVKTDHRVLHTDFRNLSTKNQDRVIPGFWTLGHLEPPGGGSEMVPNREEDAWYYGAGSDGAAGMTGLLQSRYAGLRYTPTGKDFGDMKLTMTVAPYKTAGQGFSIAGLYMDVFIKFDTETLTGYALRFIRTTKFHNAVDCLFVRYENGTVAEISEPVSTTCYRTPCTITLKVKGNILSAHAESPAGPEAAQNRPGVAGEVNMKAEIRTNPFGGFGIQYKGGAPTLIKELKVEWE